MYILYPNDPDRCQLGKEYRTFDEITRVRQDKFVIAQGIHMRKFLRNKGFHEVDVNTKKEASKILNVPMLIINKWCESGKLTMIEDMILTQDILNLNLERRSKE